MLTVQSVFIKIVAEIQFPLIMFHVTLGIVIIKNLSKTLIIRVPFLN